MLVFNCGRRSGKTLLQLEVRAMTAEIRAEWKRKTDTINMAELKGLIKLNDWESQFMNSVRSRVEAKQDLTMQQSINLNKIYRRIG